MHALFAAFGLDWRLLLVNLLNFGLLLTVLWYFLYEPLTRTLESRRQKLADGVKNAEDAAHQLKEIDGARSQMLSNAGREADEVVSNARALGLQRKQELLQEAEANATAIMSEAESQAKELKVVALEESKHEIAKLIVLGVEKAMQK